MPLMLQTTGRSIVFPLTRRGRGTLNMGVRGATCAAGWAGRHFEEEKKASRIPRPPGEGIMRAAKIPDAR